MTSPQTSLLNTHALSIAPGARILVRDEEWLVRKVDPTRTGGRSITAVGISELVRDREVVFLDELEPEIEVLKPEDTRFVADDSPRFLRSRLFLESRLRQLPPTGEADETKLLIGHQAAMDVLPYQFEPALQALDQPRPRLLIADAVGLGKTLEAGVLLSELMARGRAKRILVCTVKSMLAQFQQELWNRFAIPLTRLDSEGLVRLRDKIPANANPFHYHDKAIISLDTLKQDRAYRAYLEGAYWDAIVIDEAHHVAARGSGSQRNKLAELLAKRSDALILLSATPHDGRPESFASLMAMLDPTAIANPKDYTKDDIEGLFVRRFKEDVEAQLGAAFKPRTVAIQHAQATPAEEAAFEALLAVPLLGEKRRAQGQLLFRTVLEKALFSSPMACLETVEKRLRKDLDTSEAEALERLAGALRAIGPDRFAKYDQLLDLIRAEGWTGKDPGDRLVIFTERIETMRFLAAHLPAALGLSTAQVQTLDGRMRDTDLTTAVAAFGERGAPVRLLIASDVAAEGLNLHHCCHRLIHFDVPWSLMLFQQRNGRIDRYGQAHAPRIHYMMTDSTNNDIQGDNRVLEILVRKDAQAQKNIGDPAALMGVYDVEAEVALTAAAMEADSPPADFLAEPAGGDWLAGILEAASPQALPDVTRRTASRFSMFDSGYAYLKAACQLLQTSQELDFEANDGDRAIALRPPDDLAFRLARGPREADPGRDRLRLTADPAMLLRAVDDARASGTGRWAGWQYLWPLHPAVAWVDDKLAAGFGRHEAPVIVRPVGLAPDEALIVVTGVIPNRKSHPVVQAWMAVWLHRGVVTGVEPFEEVAAKLRLDEEAWVNPGTALPAAQTAALAKALSHAIDAARQALSQRRAAFHAAMDPRLQAQLARLAALQTRQLAYHQQRLADLDISASKREMELDRRRRQIADHFTAWEAWIRDTMTTEDQPHLQVMAAIVPAPGGAADGH